MKMLQSAEASGSSPVLLSGAEGIETKFDDQTAFKAQPNPGLLAQLEK